MGISSKSMALAMMALLWAGAAPAGNEPPGSAPAPPAPAWTYTDSWKRESNGTFSGISGQAMRPSVMSGGRDTKTGRHCAGNACRLWFTSLDANADGAITRSEFHRRTKPVGLFSQIDTNRNGVISRTELDTYNSR